MYEMCTKLLHCTVQKKLKNASKKRKKKFLLKQWNKMEQEDLEVKE
jgi:hypothetical protein